jgi:replication initiation protein RepC
MSPAASSVYVGSATALPGERLISLELLATDRAAIPFAGLPDGIASHRRLTDTIETALRCLGVSEQAITLARKLAEHTRKQDWQAGNRPIVWPSNLTLRDQLGVGDRHLRRLILELREHGALVMVDSGNRKRFGRRSPGGRIVPGQAFGFDLSTWATCHAAFADIAATHQAECAARADARRTIKTAKRQIDRMVRLAVEGGMPGVAVYGDRAAALWETSQQVEADPACTGKAAELAGIAHRIELLRSEVVSVAGSDAIAETAEQESCGSPSPKQTKMSARADSDVRLKNTTKNPVIIKSVEARREVVAGCGSTSAPTIPEAPASDFKETDAWTGAVRWDGGELDSQQLETSPAELADLVADIGKRIGIMAQPVNWGSLTAATTAFASDYGINPATVRKAERMIGWQSAHIALAVVASKSAGHFDVSPGAYYASLLAKAVKGELDLRRSLWGLRQLQPDIAARHKPAKPPARPTLPVAQAGGTPGPFSSMTAPAKPAESSGRMRATPLPAAADDADLKAERDKASAMKRIGAGGFQPSALALVGMRAAPAVKVAVKRAVAPGLAESGGANAAGTAYASFPDADRTMPRPVPDAEFAALQISIEDSLAICQQRQQAKLLAMTPTQRARHDEQERVRLAICARHRQQSLRGK